MVNLDDFKYGGTNVTAFRLLDPEREEVKQVVQDWIFGRIHKYFFVMIIYLLVLGIFKFFSIIRIMLLHFYFRWIEIWSKIRSPWANYKSKYMYIIILTIFFAYLASHEWFGTYIFFHVHASFCLNMFYKEQFKIYAALMSFFS